MTLARIVDGTIEHGPPHVATLTDGRRVSGYDRLPPSVLAAEGWVEIVDHGEPDHDPDSQYLVAELEVDGDEIVRTWTVVDLPDDPTPDVPVTPDGHHDPAIGAPDA